MMTHFKKLLDRFGKKSLLEQGVVLSFLVAVVIYGGTKPGNAPRMMIRSGDEVEEANGFTTNELAVGVVQTYVRSNEVWNFNPPPGATVIEKWRLLGGCHYLCNVVSKRRHCEHSAAVLCVAIPC